MKRKVYLDATIPSYLHDDRELLRPFIEITRRWWEEEAGAYQLFISNAVLDELLAGNYPRKDAVLETVSHLDVLPYAVPIGKIAEFYMQHRLMPLSLRGDAAHLAYASYYHCDFLLTWNCNHLANANKKGHIRVLNGRLDLPTPEIVTPLELVQEK
jgi:hypothetical protein